MSDENKTKDGKDCQIKVKLDDSRPGSVIKV